MSTSSKFDLSSGSPDRPSYATGQRGSHLAAQLDRSGSFRESLENPVLASLPNMSRSSSAITQADVVSFFQCLSFDLKVVAADHKSNRQLDFKRHLNVFLGISTDDCPSGSSKGKLLKAGIRENSVKARGRLKIFNEALSVFNKCFPSIPSRKRSRLEGFANDRSSALLSSDRPVLGPSLSKIGIQSHAVTGSFEIELQKTEERTKNVVPNKRTRTSMMDVRSNALVKSSCVVDRDREISRLANSGAIHGEDRNFSVGVDGWEKSKMKKRRSGIKPDVSPSMASNKLDGYREGKPGMQQRSVTDARSRLSSDSHGFRPGIANGVGVGKPDSIPQQAALAARSSVPRADMDNSSLLNDRRERPTGSDKERVNLRAINKTNVRDEFNSASPTTNTKMTASVRGPRSGSGVAPKLSAVVQRATAPSDWEISNCTNKPPAAVGVNNRKRTTSNRSSSPPVAHWAGQRQQKMSRIARRTNLVPVISNNDETPSVDTVPDVGGTEIGLGFLKRLAGNSPQQIKVKGDTLSSAALSESEESGAAEIKSKDKGKKSDEVDDKTVQNVQKMSTLVLSTRKNKLASGEDLGDGVRRQGRTGRGSTSTRSLSVEKLGNVGTAKQLRSARLCFDKTESKAGRPPTRKLSDRKAYTRQKHSAANATMDFLVGSDDGHEELLAAVNAVINAAHTFPSSFWRRMEPFFGFLSDADLAFLRQQGGPESTGPIPKPFPSKVDGCGSIPNGYGLIEREKELGFAMDARNVELLPDQSVPDRTDHNTVQLYERFIAALIPEETCGGGSENLKFDGYGTGFELDAVMESDGLNDMVNFEAANYAAFNGYRMTGKLEDDESEINILGSPNKGISSGHSPNGVFLDKALMAGMAFSERQYDKMGINEKIYLEAQSIGIFLEPMERSLERDVYLAWHVLHSAPEVSVPTTLLKCVTDCMCFFVQPDIAQVEDEGISDEISKLEDKYQEQVSKKKGFIDRLLRCASEMKELQEKEFVQRAHDKLVAFAYEKHMASRGSHATGGKSSSNKISKQAALAFIKRTLKRCHQYEDAGKSCFNEPVFRDMLTSGCVQPIDTPGESMKQYANVSTRSFEARVSASMGSLPSPSLTSWMQNGESYVNSSDLLSPGNCLSEQSAGKEDTWPSRIKKRELLLDDVGGAAGMTASAPSAIGNPLSSSTKGKRSERDREGKGHSREVVPRNGTHKIGRPALSNAKGERKSKAKPKQKTTQLSASVNGLLGKVSEQPKPSLSKSSETTNNNTKEKGEFMDVLDDPEAIDLSNLQIPEMEGLGGPDDLGSQAQDLSTWLNIDEEAMEDHDFMGLQIPLDDLSDLNMMV